MASGRVVTGAVDLEELEGRLVDGLAVAIAGREVVNNRADVAIRPLRIPDEADLVSGSDGSMTTAVYAIPVADDVGGTEVVGLDEALHINKLADCCNW